MKTQINPIALRPKQRPLPSAWKKAAGLLRHAPKSPLAYQKKIRSEWDRRAS